MFNRLSRIALVAAAFTLVVAACGDDDATTTTTAAPTTTVATTTTTAPMPEAMDIVETAEAAGSFATLLTAVEAAGLTETLQGEGPFTVFAPTDDAFAMLPEGTIEALLADIPSLTDILLYHVVSGAVTSDVVVGLDSAATVQGSEITIEVVDGEVILNGSVKVVTVDIAASNGVIHVIDAVLLPPAPPAEAMDIVETAEAAGSFATLLTAVEAAGLTETLQGEGPFTVFAPTDDAFAMLPEGTIEALLADIPSLTDILLYHVVSGAVTSDVVVGLDSAATVQGSEITIEVVDGEVILNGSVKVVTVDIAASNGVIHVIDAVLLP
ncbi:MAG: fasciclin domain-containing protein [Acidimicrobiia bacterium]|nr:MAG: fasciclin domain-containing protein [Acidimicrobiia bacterium]